MNNPDLEFVLTCSPVIPVVSLDRIDDGVEVARALLRGGVPIIEITLRTASALEMIREVRSQVPEICVGAGTVWDVQQLSDAVECGAQFLVSPGSPDVLLEKVQTTGLPYLPGIQTVTEARRVLDAGYRVAKFFPAEPSGGAAALKAFASVLPELRFCPTGGINLSNAAGYLALEPVCCVGGSWLTPGDVVAEKDWDAISARASEARRVLHSA